MRLLETALLCGHQLTVAVAPSAMRAIMRVMSGTDVTAVLSG